MSLHSIPSTLDIDRARRLLAKHLRKPSGVVYGNGTGQPPTALEFTPDLTAEEQARLDDILTLASCPLDWGPADLAMFKAARPTLAAYRNASAPTNAQTVAAVKKLIDVVERLVRQS